MNEWNKAQIMSDVSYEVNLASLSTRYSFYAGLGAGVSVFAEVVVNIT